MCVHHIKNIICDRLYRHFHAVLFKQMEILRPDTKLDQNQYWREVLSSRPSPLWFLYNSAKFQTSWIIDLY